MKLEEFVIQKEKRYTRKTNNTNASNPAPSFTTAAVKIGLCIAICIALCIVNISFGDDSTLFASSKENDDSPGKLRFVELPGILEVFAGGDKLTMPLGEYTAAELDDTGSLLQITSKSNATVVTCCSGVVKAIGYDNDLGDYVVIRHGDMETYYYGLEYITVEENQIINKLDTLGLLSQSGIMHFQVYESGKAENPCDYLPIDIKN